MSNRSSTVIWCVAQVLATTESLFAFFQWAPWLGAKSYSGAVALYGQVPQYISPQCQAIAVNHGQFSCLPWGSISSNPWGFALCTLLLFAGGAFVTFTQYKGKGLFCAAVIDFVSYRIDAIRFYFGFGEIERKRVSSLILGSLFGSVLLTTFIVSMLVSHING